MTSLSRRALLQTLAAGAGGVALLPIMTRLTSAGGMRTSRFVFVVEGNCFEPVTLLAANVRAELDAALAAPIGSRRWWYNDYRHAAPLVVASTAFETAPALGAIAARSLAAQTAVIYGLSSRITGGGHTTGYGVLSSARSTAGPGGPTIESYLSRLMQVRRDTPYDAVRLGVSGNASLGMNFGTCAFAARRAAPMILQPTAAFDSLFGAVGSPAARDAFRRRGRLLDFARADVRASLAAFAGNSAERAKLEAYLASLEEVSRRQERMLALAARLEAVRPPTPDTNPLYMGDDPLERFAAHLELATAALKGDLTNVVVIGSGTGGDFNMRYPSTATPDVDRHNLHHGAAANPAFLATIHDVTRIQVTAIATMARSLADTPDPVNGGTMLDHTAIVYIGDNGEQHHSTASEFPVLLIGGSGMGIETGGRTIVYPSLGQPAHRQVSNLWNTLGHAAGDDLNTFGAEARTRVAPGPLSEIFR